MIVRDRSRAFVLEHVCGWCWTTDRANMEGTRMVRYLTVWLPGHALAFYSPDAELIAFALEHHAGHHIGAGMAEIAAAGLVHVGGSWEGQVWIERPTEGGK